MSHAHRTRLAPRHHQQGVAILMVLMIVAIGSALAYSLATQQTMVMAQSRHVLVGDTMRNLLMGGEVLARQMLIEDFAIEDETGEQIDTLEEPWAQSVPPFEIPGGFIEVQARDLNSCFNLNSIPTAPASQASTAGAAGSASASGDAGQLFREILARLDIDNAFADRWKDWIDSDDQVTNFGAEDEEYLSRETGYRAPNAMAGHVSEFLLLDELDYEDWLELQKVICLVPGRETKINVNTLSLDVISALTGNTFDEDEELVPPHYTSPEEFTTAVPSLAKFISLFGVQSDVFEISVRADVDGESATMVSTLYRDRVKRTVTVLGRDFSRRFVSKLTTEIEEDV